MAIHEIDEPGRASAAPREGLFDAQLSLSPLIVPSLSQPATFQKRDDRVVVFQPRKIEHAIFRSARSIGREDRELARRLAPAISLYLARTFKDETPTAHHVREAVERVLLEMGHKATAEAFVRYGRSSTSTQSRDGAQASFPETPPGHAALKPSNRSRNPGGNRLKPAASPVEISEDKLLGLPSAEVGRIVQTSVAAPAHGELSPDSTNRRLAGRLKAQYALAQVFTPEVARAHRSGDIHLHGLASVDRLENIRLPLEYVKRYGIPLTAPPGLPPAGGPERLAAQAAAFTCILQRYFTGIIGWDAVNYYFAPLLSGYSESAFDELARILIEEFAYHSMIYGRPWADSTLRGGEIEVSWEVPEYLLAVEAAQAHGRSTGVPYEGWSHNAQQLAWALVSAYRNAPEGPLDRAPRLVIRITASFFQTPGHQQFLHHAAQVVAPSVPVAFRFDRGAPILPHTGDPMAHRETIAHRVTLNLPRAAFKSCDRPSLLSELDRSLDLAVSAHLQKETFISGLLAHRDGGPLEGLTTPRGGRPFLTSGECLYLTGVTGLDECVRVSCGQGMERSGEARALGETILTHLRRRCTEWSRSLELGISLAATARQRVDQRFATLDRERFGAEISEAPYTAGVGFPHRHAASPMALARGQNALHAQLSHGADIEAVIHESETSPASIAQLVELVFRETECGQFSVVPG